MASKSNNQGQGDGVVQALGDFADTIEGTAAAGAPDETMDELLTLDQAVQFLGTSKPTMHRLLRQGDISGLKVGRQWRFRKADLIAHMERRPPEVGITVTPELDAELDFFAVRLREAPGAGAALVSGEAPDAGDPGNIVRLVNAIMALGIRLGASDMHLEPEQAGVRLRYRIDGVLQPVRTMPGRLHQPLVGRVKVMAEMDVTEKRLPQDGRIHVKHGEKAFDLRVACLPTVLGEAVAIRILDQSSVIVSRERLGFLPEDWEQVQSWLRQPNGLIIFTGPTGSGKTTVLYSCLMEATTPHNKVVSIEDPVEYQLPGVTQMHVNRKVGLTFATAVRAMLRSDPDILMIGEIHDLETAELAHQAALTGHLVLSVLHTNSAAGAIVRLLDMGMAPFLVTQALVGVTGQRLVRRICPDCREPAPVPETLLQRVRPQSAAGGYAVPEDAAFFTGKGCARCRHTGYRGRIGLYEVLRWSSDLAAATLRRPSEKELTDIAVARGMKTLLADGVRKAVEGMTSLDEVLRMVTLPL